MALGTAIVVDKIHVEVGAILDHEYPYLAGQRP